MKTVSVDENGRSVMKTVTVDEIKKAPDCVVGYEYVKTEKGKKLGAKVYVSQALGAIARIPEEKAPVKEIDITPAEAEEGSSPAKDRSGSRK